MIFIVLLFVLFASPTLFKVTRALGNWVASPEGLPKMGGLLLHGILFTLVRRALPRSEGAKAKSVTG